MKNNEILAEELGVSLTHVNNVIELLNAGSTVPFIARYRKEMTGEMSDEVLRQLFERLTYLTTIEERKTTILSSIEEQGLLTDELKKQIDKVLVLSELEDIYRPFKPKKKTRASVAISKGLAPLAKYIIEDRTGMLKEEVKKYIDGEIITTEDEAISGAKDIIAEMISDKASYRAYIKREIVNNGIVTTIKTKEATSNVYDMYDNYSERIKSIPPHRILAIARGQKEKQLKAEFKIDDDQVKSYLLSNFFSYLCKYQQIAEEIISDSYKRLIKPSVDTDIDSDLFSRAEESSLLVFKANLHELLMVSPLKGRVVLGFDPGFRTGCKLAVIDATGKVLDTGVIYPTTDPKLVPLAKSKLIYLIKKHEVKMISLGNGTASRESEEFIKDAIIGLDCDYVITSEAGASIYSASELGNREFPEYDVSLRSAVSIARRLLDPLSELVKIDPMSIGVGQYQHDLNQKRLKESLTGVVEDAVNAVGVDLNLASPSLLSYVSGINKTIAEEIFLHRDLNGAFKNRTELKKVKKLGPKAFEQCAGFLRIKGNNLLDNTSIHPESYDTTKKFLAHENIKLENITSAGEQLSQFSDYEGVSKLLGVGEVTLRDIVKELLKPGRDPREDVIKAKLDHTITKIDDLKIGMILEGTVRNIIDFGAFVDIGVHEDGLVHISEIVNKFIKHPLDVLKIGQIVKVKVISLDLVKKRIGLSMKQVEEK